MILNCEYNEFLQIFKLYLSPEFNTLDLFTNQIVRTHPCIEPEEAEILWKAFDIAYEYTINYGNILKDIKEVKNDPTE